MSNRIITGLVAAAILIVLLYFRNIAGGVVFYGAILFIYLVAIGEMIRSLQAKGYKPSTWPIYLTAVALAVSYRLWGSRGMMLVFCLGVVTTLSFAMLRREPSQGDVFASAFPLIYPTVPFMALFMIVSLPEPDKLVLLLTFFLSSIASDSFALVFGLNFGKHKLIPRVSPQKTWEGAIGGLFSTIVIITIFGWGLNAYLGQQFPIWQFAILGALGSIATQLGDLVASSIKRYCGVKDFGTFFPGHGGVLDRLDGMLFNAIFLYAYYMFAIGGLIHL